jgi:hypothetical protein
VSKIFEEGLKNAEAIIVVLSNNSVNKPWIREELDASVVKKVEGLAKLIPVVIDDCEVPKSLKSTVWQKIENLDDSDTEFSRIVASIYGHMEKPSLGPPPAYVQTVVDTLPDLTKVDSLVMKWSCERAIEEGYFFIETKDVWEQTQAGLGAHTRFRGPRLVIRSSKP